MVVTLDGVRSERGRAPSTTPSAPVTAGTPLPLRGGAMDECQSVVLRTSSNLLLHACKEWVSECRPTAMICLLHACKEWVSECRPHSNDLLLQICNI